MKKFNVMIIEDDFRIANIHKEMVENNQACEVINSSRTSEEALLYLEEMNNSVDIILLDIYIPDVKELDLLKKIKRKYPFISVIIASAANDIGTIRAAKQLGIFDYLLKPIEKKRLETAFQRLINLLTYPNAELTQHDIDRLLGDFPNVSPHHSKEQSSSNLPKGIDSLTLAEVQSFLNTYNQKNVTAQILADLLGISRATARRYLEYLVGIDWIEASLNYGQVGRPQRIYTIREQYEQN